MTGRVHKIESFATLDGTGIRCAVFLSGCNLRCKCCHNADTWGSAGIEYTAEALARRILRFKPYFVRGGGATFSGGEPLLQAAFLKEVADLLAAQGVGTALDTSGSVLNDDVRALLEAVELVICDLKCTTEEKYRSFCGGSLVAVKKFLGVCRELGKRLWLRTVVIPGYNDTAADMAEYAAIARAFPHEK